MSPRKRPSAARTVVALALLALTSTVVFRALLPQANRLRQGTITLPAGVGFADNPARFAISRDGRQFAINLRDATGVRVWTWSLDGVDARPIRGTDGSSSTPAWSPDGQNIAFVSDGKLRRIAAAGGPVITIAEAATDATFDWGDDDTLLLASGGTEPIRRLASGGGGTMQQITKVFPDEQHEYPRFVPGDRRFVFVVHADERREGIWLGALDGGRALRIVPGGANAVVAGDFLVYSLEQLIIAQRFDPASSEFSGVPVTLADHVRIDDRTHALAFAASFDRPVLVYQSDADGVLRLVTGWTTLLNGK